MKDNDSIDPRLETFLEDLRVAPERDQRAAARARNRFVQQAVSMRQRQRHSLWTFIPAKERFAMNLIVLATLVVGLLFGGGATVSAAQNDLPGQPLYQLKLASEAGRLWLASSPDAKINVLMEQAQTRLQEMTQLVAQGSTPPAEIGSRMQEHIRLALQLADGLPEPSRTAALDRIRQRLQTQEQLMLQLEQVAPGQAEPILEQTRLMLQTQLRQAEQDLVNPGGLQQQEQNQSQEQNQDQQQNQNLNQNYEQNEDQQQNQIQDQIQNQDQQQDQQQDQIQLRNQSGVPSVSETTEAPSILQGSCTCTPALDGTGEQYRTGNPDAGTPEPPAGNGSGGSH